MVNKTDVERHNVMAMRGFMPSMLRPAVGGRLGPSLLEKDTTSTRAHGLSV